MLVSKLASFCECVKAIKSLNGPLFHLIYNNIYNIYQTDSKIIYNVNIQTNKNGFD